MPMIFFVRPKNVANLFPSDPTALLLTSTSILGDFWNGFGANRRSNTFWKLYGKRFAGSPGDVEEES